MARPAALGDTVDLDSARVRLTQPERVEAMRERLLDATVGCLVQYGYSAMSTNDVVRRAGVSRGALAHHFPTKADLVLAAAERIITQRTEEFRTRFNALPPEERTVTLALDVLWTLFGEDSFAALLELTVAARSTPELSSLIASAPESVAQQTLAVFRDGFPHLAEVPFIEQVLRGILAMYSGLAMQVLLDGDPQSHHQQVREMVAVLLSSAERGFKR